MKKLAELIATLPEFHSAGRPHRLDPHPQRPISRATGNSPAPAPSRCWKPSAETFELSRERFSVVGRADTVPVDSNDTPEGRARNRRVDVVIVNSLRHRERGRRQDHGPTSKTVPSAGLYASTATRRRSFDGPRPACKKIEKNCEKPPPHHRQDYCTLDNGVIRREAEQRTKEDKPCNFDFKPTSRRCSRKQALESEHAISKARRFSS